MGEHEALIKTSTEYKIDVQGKATRRHVAEVRSAVKVSGGRDSVTLFIGASNRILYVNAPYALGFDTNSYSLPVHKLDEDLKTFRDLIEDWLYSLYVTASASELIATHVASMILQYFTKQDTDLDFDAVLSVNSTREVIRLRTDDKLEKKEEHYDCTICLGRNIKAKKILPCGHAYHKRCILTWYKHSKSCPLCRIPLP